MSCTDSPPCPPKGLTNFSQYTELQKSIATYLPYFPSPIQRQSLLVVVVQRFLLLACSGAACTSFPRASQADLWMTSHRPGLQPFFPLDLI